MATQTSDNADTVRRYLRAFNDREWGTLRDLLADDVVEHGAHEEFHGPDEIVAFLQEYFEVFPDYSGSTERLLVDGDTVAVRYEASGTHSESYEDIEPTGHTVEWSGMAMYEITDDEITEVWIEEDRFGLLEQLEVVDPPAHLRL